MLISNIDTDPSLRVSTCAYCGVCLWDERMGGKEHLATTCCIRGTTERALAAMRALSRVMFWYGLELFAQVWEHGDDGEHKEWCRAEVYINEVVLKMLGDPMVVLAWRDP